MADTIYRYHFNVSKDADIIGEIATNIVLNYNEKNYSQILYN